MTDNERSNDGPILGREAAPEHGPTFWTDLGAMMADDTAVLPSVTRTVAPLAPEPSQISRRETSKRRIWPLAAAAALLAVVGVGALALRGPNNPGAVTEIVAGPTEEAAGLLDGPDDGSGDDGATAADAEDSSNPDSSNAEGEPASPASGNAGSEGAVDGDSSTETPPVTTSPTSPMEFLSAVGAAGSAQFLPLGGQLPDHTTFLANWPERALSWFATTDLSRDCSHANYSEISIANGSGLAFAVRDPQLRFSGDVGHFTVNNEKNLAAWLVSCGAQLELYVATLEWNGQVVDLDIAWFGEGQAASALVLWDQNEVNLSALGVDGKPFSVNFGFDTRIASRDGGPSRILLETGAPSAREFVPLALSPDAALSYWAGAASETTTSACADQFANADTLWLRRGEGQWAPAVVDGTPLGWPTAMALEPEFSQVAFADLCDDQAGRLFVGTQRADGSLSNLQQFDLAPYVPGFAENLFWVDSQTLRIETNNTQYGFGTVRFDLVFEDGQTDAIIVQLD